MLEKKEMCNFAPSKRKNISFSEMPESGHADLFKRPAILNSNGTTPLTAQHHNSPSITDTPQTTENTVCHFHDFTLFP